MTLYHVNVSQYDDVLNNNFVFKFHMLEVIEFRIGFQSVRYKYNQTDLHIISNHF